MSSAAVLNSRDNFNHRSTETLFMAAKSGNQIFIPMADDEDDRSSVSSMDSLSSGGEKELSPQRGSSKRRTSPQRRESPRRESKSRTMEPVLPALPAHLTLINLKDEYNFTLLEDFYYRIMKPNFPMEEELDSLENFDNNLRNNSFLDTEIAVLFDENTQMVAAGVIYDYYSVSNVGLLSYFCVDQRDARYRGMGLGKFLVIYAYQRCQAMARAFNKSREGRNFRKVMLSQLFNHDPEVEVSLQRIFKEKYFLNDASKNDMFAFLAETNRLGVSDGVLESDIRHKILNSIGFRFLDFEYVQPPLYDTMPPCYDLILLAYKDSVQPTKDGQRIVHRDIIHSFMTEAAYAVSETKPFDYREESYFTDVEEVLHTGPENYPLLEMPWALGSSRKN